MDGEGEVLTRLDKRLFWVFVTRDTGICEEETLGKEWQVRVQGWGPKRI